jgi:hypothetical protein
LRRSRCGKRRRSRNGLPGRRDPRDSAPARRRANPGAGRLGRTARHDARSADGGERGSRLRGTNPRVPTRTGPLEAWRRSAWAAAHAEHDRLPNRVRREAEPDALHALGASRRATRPPRKSPLPRQTPSPS